MNIIERIYHRQDQLAMRNDWCAQYAYLGEKEMAEFELLVDRYPEVAWIDGENPRLGRIEIIRVAEFRHFNIGY